MKAIYTTISPQSRVMHAYSIQEENLESEESFAGHGLFPRTKKFYSLKEEQIVNDGKDPDSFGGFIIQRSLDIINHNRSIYSALDFLGDVGGLFSILIDIGQIMVSLPVYLFGYTI